MMSQRQNNLEEPRSDGLLVEAFFMGGALAGLCHLLIMHYGLPVNVAWAVAAGGALALADLWVLPRGVSTELYAPLLCLALAAALLWFGLFGVRSEWTALLIAATCYAIYQKLAPSPAAERLNALADRHPVHFAGAVGLLALATAAASGFATRGMAWENSALWRGLQAQNGAIVVVLLWPQLYRCLKRATGGGEGGGDEGTGSA
jgi:hypothetical protein